jgi:hypothetical protein
MFSRTNAFPALEGCITFPRSVRYPVKLRGEQRLRIGAKLLARSSGVAEVFPEKVSIYMRDVSGYKSCAPQGWILRI